MFGRKRCLAHLHGQTSGSPAMDTIYGGVLALSEFIRDDYLQNSSLDRRSAYILYNCIDTERFRPAPPPMALRTRLGFGPRDFVMLFCGRLEPDKGIHKLMEALEQAAGAEYPAADRGQSVLWPHPAKQLFAQAGAAGQGAGRPRTVYRLHPQRGPTRLLPPGRPWSVCRPWWRKPPGW